MVRGDQLRLMTLTYALHSRAAMPWSGSSAFAQWHARWGRSTKQINAAPKDPAAVRQNLAHVSAPDRHTAAQRRQKVGKW